MSPVGRAAARSREMMREKDGERDTRPEGAEGRRKGQREDERGRGDGGFQRRKRDVSSGDKGSGGTEEAPRESVVLFGR